MRAQVADGRREFQHQLSTRIVREHQAVVVEDLAVPGMARTRLAKSVHDAGWAAFASMLRYKCERYVRAFIKIGRFEPTTRCCHACGPVDGSKPLDIREWDCSACGAHLDRGINAAINVKDAAGRAVYA